MEVPQIRRATAHDVRQGTGKGQAALRQDAFMRTDLLWPAPERLSAWLTGSTGTCPAAGHDQPLTDIMLGMSKEKLAWKTKPDKGDYDAAQAYLSLVFRTPNANALVKALHKAPVTQRSAKDLLRASGLPLLPDTEASVGEDLRKISKGKPLAPVLLVCGDMTKGITLTVADGYHRICAVCHYDEFAPIACQMVENRR